MSKRAGQWVSWFSTGGVEAAGRKNRGGSKLERRNGVRGNPGSYSSKWRMNQRCKQLEKWDHEITQGKTWTDKSWRPIYGYGWRSGEELRPEPILKTAMLIADDELQVETGGSGNPELHPEVRLELRTGKQQASTSPTPWIMTGTHCFARVEFFSTASSLFHSKNAKTLVEPSLMLTLRDTSKHPDRQGQGVCRSGSWIQVTTLMRDAVICNWQTHLIWINTYSIRTMTKIGNIHNQRVVLACIYTVKPANGDARLFLRR